MRFLFFRADGCGVCRAKEPVVAALSRERGLPLEIVDLDLDTGRQRAEQLRIRTVPTLALVDGERVRFRVIGRMITPENVDFLLAKQ